MADPRWAPPETILVGSIDENSPSLEAASGADFPSSGQIIIGREVLGFAKATDTVWSLARGERGSTPLRHFNRATVTLLVHTIIAGGIDYTALALGTLRTKEVSPRGEIEATWEFDSQDANALIPAMYSGVLISDEEGAYFGGFIGRIAKNDRDDGSAHVALTARGYIVTAEWNGYQSSQVFPAFTAGHTIFEESRGDLCPLISSDNEHVIDGGLSIAQDMEAIGHSALQIWTDLGNRGDSDAQPLDWGVWTDDDGVSDLWLMIRGRQPTITIPRTSVGNIPLAWDSERQRTLVVVKWRDGYTTASAPTSPTKWLYKDFSSQIDNLDLAVQVANQILAATEVLNAIGDGPLVLQWPRGVVYDDDGNPVPLWRVRAGWFVQIEGLTAPSEDLPIPTFQIKAVDREHGKYRVSWELGDLLEDDLDLAAQFTGRQMRQVAPAPGSGVLPNFVTSPDGVPSSMGTNLVGTGSGGQIGAAKVADDFDMSTIWFAIAETDPDTGILVAKTYYKNPIPIDVRMIIRGLRLKATDDADPPGAAGTLSVSVTRGTAGSYPALGDAVGSIQLSTVYENLVNFAEHATDEHTEGFAFHVEPEEYLLVTVDASPAPDLFTGATLGILVQRTEGSSRGAEAGAPSILTASASRDAGNNTTFIVTTDRVCSVQISYGADTTYGSRSRRSEQLKRVTSITVPGLPFPEAHWVAIATDIDGHESAPSSDQTV